MHSGEMFDLSSGREDAGYFYSKNIPQHLIHCMIGTNAGLTIRKETKGISFIKGERREQLWGLPRTWDWDQEGTMCIFISLKLGLCGKPETSRNMRNLSAEHVWDAHTEI